MSTPLSTSAAAALAGLKDFQRETVDYVFGRLFAPGGSRRFLVADEVGLGKTMIARGVIARAIDSMRARARPSRTKGDRIDVIYICSNGDIARQNINRLRVEGKHVAFASRLTLLPLKVSELRDTKSGVNFISFTPGTSFDVHGGLGQVEERVLLYAMLREIWELGSRAAPMNVLQGNVTTQRFRDRAGSFDLSAIDPQRHSLLAFQNAIEARNVTARDAGVPTLRERFDTLTRAFSKDGAKPSREAAGQRARIVGELRAVLAASCIEALEPDIIILDEFQRFGHLLDGDDEGSQLARQLFTFKDVAVLLLSATPYKMYTSADEANGEDHYRDFVRTLRFLEREGGPDSSVDALLKNYRRALLSTGEPNAAEKLHAATRALEDRLRDVMVRTERLASTPDRNGMLVEIPAPEMPVREGDILDYVALQKVSNQLEEGDVLEYWKSAPFVLNYMDEAYALKRSFDTAVDNPDERASIARALANGPTACLPWDRVEAYREVELGNPRVRAILADTVGRGAHRLLWIPASLPYYRPTGTYADPALRTFTKRLIFSSWRLVPRAISSLVSYEAERRMVGRVGEGANTREARKRRPRLLEFKRSDGRLSGMPVLALMYPSSYLARACDPAHLAKAAADGRSVSEVDVDVVLREAEANIEVALGRLKVPHVSDGPEDERWYWAAPLLLDQVLEPVATNAWFGQANLAALWAGRADVNDDVDHDAESDGPAWDEHVREACAFALGKGEPLRRMPTDLVPVLARIAIGAPGVTMLRAMLRVVDMRPEALGNSGGVKVRNGAAKAAWSFRGLFNQPEVMSLLGGDAPYWRQVLDYCVDGCLQAVLDEYAHVLRDHLGLSVGTAAEKVHQIADQICEAMSLRTVNIGVTQLGLSEAGRTLKPQTKRMRCHFALRFGDERDEDDEIATRADSVRKAFNSPFWPFVVATTSVGQEGLDFHTYCHAVVHWNLPSNPVDLEQREGRVHRYKGHAVRKNVALVHGARAIDEDAVDPWSRMFEDAERDRPEGATDIVPYWVYAPAGGARIERHVPLLPLSREHDQLRALSKSLAVYRMVFGQPRQDDLVRYLAARVDAATLEHLLVESRIDLSPREAMRRS